MNPFNFNRPTEIFFGKDQVKVLPEVLARFGKNVLMVYGGGSIKKIGLYDRVKELTADFNVFELGGIEPNPKIESVREGGKICKEQNIDVVLAVGGGSTIDASKSIAAAACYDGDAWDFVEKGSLIQEALPVVCILTISATGSEMNQNSVISDMSRNLKKCANNKNLIPKVSICDPSYQYSLPAIQTAAGTADIMSHTMEQYFQKESGAYLTDRMCEQVLRTCIKYCPIALEEPENYEARANLMWASTLGLNGILTGGKGGGWTCHPIEHELSAYYDITHGVGLAIVTPAWMRYILSEATLNRFYDFAVNVWDIPESEDRMAVANQGIDALEKFFVSIGIPMKLSEVGIGEEKIDEMAHFAVVHNNLEKAPYVPLKDEDVAKILRACL